VKLALGAGSEAHPLRGMRKAFSINVAGAILSWRHDPLSHDVAVRDA
jgi:hypothetical protein